MIRSEIHDFQLKSHLQKLLNIHMLQKNTSISFFCYNTGTIHHVAKFDSLRLKCSAFQLTTTHIYTRERTNRASPEKFVTPTGRDDKAYYIPISSSSAFTHTTAHYTPLQQQQHTHMYIITYPSSTWRRS